MVLLIRLEIEADMAVDGVGLGLVVIALSLEIFMPPAELKHDAIEQPVLNGGINGPTARLASADAF